MKRVTIMLFVSLVLLCGCKATQREPVPAKIAVSQQEVYIPKDLDECFVQLEKLLKPKDIEKMRSGTEQDMVLYHINAGMWMRNNWGLWRGSHLAKWFNTQGIWHPDDMSGIILDSFWRHLNNKPINLDQQVKSYQDYWMQQGAVSKEAPSDTGKQRL
jgi:hypothetical protein